MPIGVRVWEVPALSASNRLGDVLQSQSMLGLVLGFGRCPALRASNCLGDVLQSQTGLGFERGPALPFSIRVWKMSCIAIVHAHRVPS